MFTFALAFFAGHRFFFIFNLFPFFVGRGRRNLEESFHNDNHRPQLHMSDVKCQTDRFACSGAYFSSFPKENAFQSLEENLWTINTKTEFPDFSLTVATLRRVSLRHSKIEAIRYSDRRYNTRDWIYLIYVLQKQNFIFSLYLQWA